MVLCNEDICILVCTLRNLDTRWLLDFTKDLAVENWLFHIMIERAFIYSFKEQEIIIKSDINCVDLIFEIERENRFKIRRVPSYDFRTRAREQNSLVIC